MSIATSSSALVAGKNVVLLLISGHPGKRAQFEVFHGTVQVVYYMQPVALGANLSYIHLHLDDLPLSSSGIGEGP